MAEVSTDSTAACGGDRERTEVDRPDTQNDEILTVFKSLKAPKLSDLTRKRKVDSNPPPKGKRRARGEGANEPKTVTASQRIKEFPGECLTTAGKGGAKLFCGACREELSLKKNVIVSHVSCNKHKAGKAKLATKEARDILIRCT